jgi:nicotinamide mononucleotide transporter
MSALEIAGASTGILSVWLTTREKVWCWPAGIVSVALYVIVFWRARLYAAMGLQVIYIGLAAYGWQEWRRGGRAGGPLQVSRATPRAVVASAAVGLAGAALLAALLRRHTDAALPVADAATAAFSLVAQWMQTRKLVENWLVWLAVDSVYVGLYLSQRLLWTAGLYAVYTGLAVSGLALWRRSLRSAA